MISNYITQYENSDILGSYESTNISSDLGIAEYYLNDYNKAYIMVNEYKKITQDDLKRVAAKYFSEEQVQVINIKPE